MSRQKEIEALVNHPTWDYMFQRQLGKLIPRKNQSPQNLRKFYAKIMKEGGLDDEAAAFFYKADLMFKVHFLFLFILPLIL